MKWEYKCEEISNANSLAAEGMTDYLNKIGEEGWELVESREDSSFDLLILIFKRPKA